MRLLRPLTLVLAALLVLTLALASGVVMVFCIQGGRASLSLTHLSHLIHLPGLRHDVARLLDRLQATGPVAIITVLVALGVMIIALLVLAGLLIPTRELRVILSEEDGATISARRRALAGVARDLALRADGVAEAKVRARPGRRRGGRLTVRAWRILPASRDEVRGAVLERLSSLTGSFKLRARISVRDPRSGRRVQ
jgi:hypothetical protein